MLTGAIGLSALVGCEAPDPDTVEALASRLEQGAQRRFGGGQKTGMLRALEVSQRAVGVARAMRERPEPACAMEELDGRAFRYDIELVLERHGPGKAGLEASWRETRRFRRAESGRLELVMNAQFRNPTMQPTDAPTKRALRWALADGQSYLSDDLREGAPQYYRREASFGEAAALEYAAFGTLQTLLDAAPGGWERVDAAHPTWTPGGQPLRCIKPIRGLQNAKNMQMQSPVIERNWLHQFGAVATLKEARFEVLRAAAAPEAAGNEADDAPANSRRLSLAWRLSDGATLKAKFRDSWAPTGAPLESLDTTNIIEVERDRSLFEAKQRLQEWRENAWIRSASEDETP